MANMVPRGNSPTELRRAFQWNKKHTGILTEGASGEVLVGAGAGSTPAWGTELTALTLLTVDNITINAATIASDTGAISFGDENLSTTGTITGVNVTSGESPGHTHDNSYYTETELDAGQLDSLYFQESEYVDSSAGVGDSGKPIVLNADGEVDITMIPDGVGVTDHGALDGLGDDDHTIYLLADGTRGLTGDLSVDALVTIDGRDLSIDGTKLDGIEENADVTDAANVAAAGAAMAGGAFHDGFSDYVAAEHVLLPAALADIVSDTTATGANLTTLTDDSMADSLHRHSELSASDGTPDRAFYVNSDGNMVTDAGKIRLGDSIETWKYKIEIWSDRAYGDGLLFSSADSTGASSAPTLYFVRHRGTTSSPAIVQNGDRLMRIAAVGNDGHGSLAYKAAARIEGRVDGAPTPEVAVPGSIVFMTSPSGSATPADRMIVKSTGYVGINSTPDSRLEVQTETGEGVQALTIDQNDADKAFIDFQGTSAASAANNISTWVSGATLTGFTRQEINGTEYWMPYYGAPTGAALATEYVPASVTLNAGSNTAGDVDSVAAMLESDTYDVDEVAATPGFDIEFAFSGVVAFTGVRVRCLYNGGSSHTVEIRLYNYNTTSWDTVLEFTDQAYQTILEFPVLDDTNYISGGAAKVTVYHSSAGNAAHDISVDYVALTYGDEFSYPQSDHGLLSGNADDDHTQYSLADGTRAFTGVVSGVTPTADAHLSTKAYVDDAVEPPFPAWETNSDGWDDVQEAMSFRWGRNRARSTHRCVNTFGSLSGSNKWWGGVVADNGKIYGIPRDSTTVLEIDPSDDSVSTFGSLSGSGKWYGGVLAPNGYIYCAPAGSTSILKIDPSTPSASTFGTVTAGRTGCVLANNGMIYCIPGGTASDILKIDPTSDSTSTFGSTSGAYFGGVLAPNGKIYGVPWSSTSVLEIDPSADTVSEIGSVPSGNKWVGGVLAPNGLIYFIPSGYSYIGIFDPDTYNMRYITGYSVYSYGFYGGCLGPDGRIYMAANGNSELVRVDPDAEEYQEWWSLSGSNRYTGCVMADNGCIYFIPRDATAVLKLGLDLTGGVHEDWHLSRYFNKF